MKNIYIAALVFALILPLASCSDFWGGDEPEVIYYESMANVHNIQTNNIIFKSNPHLYFTSQDGFDLDDSIAEGDRVWLYFTLVDSVSPSMYNIHIYSYAEVDSRPFYQLEKDTNDTILSQDIYQLQKCWISDNYLNVIFYAFASVSPNSSFELVRDMNREDTLAAKPKIYLDLRHNTASVTPYWYNLEMMSFDLRPIREQYAGQDTIAVQFSYTLGSKQHVNFYYLPQADEIVQE
ncbi:MAG: NigD-like C-terminal domain-containing protein [Bacteroidales bacterium]|nr:NigD-like C-terminal domain-containing protein [Bacteroidales bacterium]